MCHVRRDERERKGIKYMARNIYKILFYEENNYLYYITTDKEVVKMKEKVKNYLTHRYEVPMTDEDTKMINNKFNLDAVYQEKILDFKKIKGTRPKEYRK